MVADRAGHSRRVSGMGEPRLTQRERIAIRAARLRVTCDRKLGHTTPAWVTELAQRELEPS